MTTPERHDGPTQVPNAPEGMGQEAEKRPVQAHFLREVLDATRKVPSVVAVRNWNITVSYWASDNATYEEVGRVYGITRSRARYIVISTMAKLLHNSPPEISTKYPLDRLIRAKNRS